MKKFYFYLMAVFAVFAASTTFTSCTDDDTEEAMVLSGEWQGNFGMYYSDGYYEYDAAYSNLRFLPDYEYATHGEGEEIDFFDYRSGCPIRYQSFYFLWSVRYGRIYLEFPYNHNLDVVITDYRLSNSYFSGIVGNTSFNLRKLVGYYDWNYYGDNYYGYGYWDGYYAKTRSTATADSTAVVSPENFTFGRRF